LAAQESSIQRNTGDAALPNQAAKRTRYPRVLTSTLYRIITGHAFVGAYTQRFYPRHTRANRLPVRRAGADHRAHTLDLPTLQHSAPQAPNGERPAPKHKTTFQQPKKSPSSAPLPRGDRSLRKTPGNLGTTLRHNTGSRSRPFIQRPPNLITLLLHLVEYPTISYHTFLNILRS
jgi:hypothetical protein